MTEASAPGKLILCGEHAVVYGQPAIALPLSDIRAYAQVAPAPPESGIHLQAPDLERVWTIVEEPTDPMSELTRATLHHIGISDADLTITLRSDIPIASGMGSGAAIATALVRALAAHFEHQLSPSTISALVYTSEQRYHGTPSGVDNTVVAYEQAIWFERRGASPEHRGADSENRGGSPVSPSPTPTILPVAIAAPFTLVIGDTGIRSATRLPVGEVRLRWLAEPAHYEALFEQIGTVVHRVREALAAGDHAALGRFLNTNQTLLEHIGVSSPELEHLIAAARAAGALGAKLSGAGWGGIMFALTTIAARDHVIAALRAAGATRVLETAVTAQRV